MTNYHANYGRRSKKKRSKLSRFLYTVLFILILGAIGFGYYLYGVIFKPNTWTGGEAKTAIYVPTGTDYSGLLTILYSNGIVVNRKSFEWLADKKSFASSVKPGKYTIYEGLNNNELINLLRSGQQTPVKLIINNIRTKEDFGQRVAEQIEIDSSTIVNLLYDTDNLRYYGLNPDNALTLFIPNTYEVYWDVKARDLFERMYTEYKSFWNETRLKKADEIDMTPEEVYIMASIVEKETNKNDEKPTIAGVYKNRLTYNWRLQADPTIVYAWGDFSIRRVLNIHKQIDSPYNTYMYEGLPPGPICIPSISSIDAVLNLEDHIYLFFCAKDDFSGYHVFSSTNAGHALNANKYRKALDERNIRK